ncbi:MAG: serine protease [Planctomycetota bacterium]
MLRRELRSSAAGLNRLPFCFGLLATILFCVGCNREAAESNRVAAPTVPGELQQERESLVAESWVSKSKTQWPQIVLTNEAEFEGNRSLRGASGFLIQTRDERVLAATAAHLIGPAGGVEPEIAVNELTSKLRFWKMFPRTRPTDSVSITSLGAPGLDDPNLDWLLLSVSQRDQLPAQPLRLREEPVRVGETVFLLGCPYVESDCQQNVYRGRVTERAYGDRFRYDIEPAVDIRGFSGAPIIDEKGYLVGVMTVWFDPKMDGDNYLEAGGEDVASIYDAVEREK